jgi:hypothetical protein
MDIKKTPTDIIDGIKDFFTKLPQVNYGSNAIDYLNLEKYGSGQVGFNSLVNDFNTLDLATLITSTDFDKKIKIQKKELKELENKHTNITAIIGDNIGGQEGSLAKQIINNLNLELEGLIKKRDALASEIELKDRQIEDKLSEFKKKEVSQIENLESRTIALEKTFSDKTTKLVEEFKGREESLKISFNKFNEETKSNTDQVEVESRKKIREAEANASQKVKLINQFKDFLEETNENMKLYRNVIIGILLVAIVSIGFSIPKLLNIYESYDVFIKSHNSKITNWQIINYGLGLLIVKLPWALCLSAVLTGMYSLLKGLLNTYEKINQDKRNMSAIYSIAGNVAQALNEYGIDLANDETEDEETGEITTIIKVSRRELLKKKENFRWNQIMKYFERMQLVKEIPEKKDDPVKQKILTDILNKVIDKIPIQK